VAAGGVELLTGRTQAGVGSRLVAEVRGLELLGGGRCAGRLVPERVGYAFTGRLGRGATAQSDDKM